MSADEGQSAKLGIYHRAGGVYLNLGRSINRMSSGLTVLAIRRSFLLRFRSHADASKFDGRSFNNNIRDDHSLSDIPGQHIDRWYLKSFHAALKT